MYKNIIKAIKTVTKATADSKIGSTLKKCRIAKNLTLKDITKNAMSVSQLSKIERNITVPTPQMLKYLQNELTLSDDVIKSIKNNDNNMAKVLNGIVNKTLPKNLLDVDFEVKEYILENEILKYTYYVLEKNHEKAEEVFSNIHDDIEYLTKNELNLVTYMTCKYLFNNSKFKTMLDITNSFMLSEQYTDDEKKNYMFFNYISKVFTNTISIYDKTTFFDIDYMLLNSQSSESNYLRKTALMFLSTSLSEEEFLNKLEKYNIDKKQRAAALSYYYFSIGNYKKAYGTIVETNDKTPEEKLIEIFCLEMLSKNESSKALLTMYANKYTKNITVNKVVNLLHNFYYMQDKEIFLHFKNEFTKIENYFIARYLKDIFIKLYVDKKCYKMSAKINDEWTKYKRYINS